jgi:hypothetical protein
MLRILELSAATKVHSSGGVLEDNSYSSFTIEFSTTS